ncbi:hypothetical protein F3L20_10905 [Streptomyces tendae]|uniref:Secreted protein n=1 Tax=Streptomyces tendae TaxID=1932 RepID=A0ABX5ZNT9_STRTE|nr:hypothetical protein F3L20_10905 [Streptomyces tendae]
MFFFKGTSTIRNRMDGVSTYLALTFGTLLSSQGTDASFVLTLSGFPPGASLRCFQTVSGFFRPSDHRPAGMQKAIQGEDLTSWIAARRPGGVCASLSPRQV